MSELNIRLFVFAFALNIYPGGGVFENSLMDHLKVMRDL